MIAPEFILASASPRRRQLLEEAGYAFRVVPSEVEEPEPGPSADPVAYASGLSWKKARSVARAVGRGWVLGADTVCHVDGVILNKPADRDDAERMIRLQEGRDTSVFTAMVLYRAEDDLWVGSIDESIVRFRPLAEGERTGFLDSGRWAGKAGAYGLQDRDPFVSLRRGTWSNVVGLSVERLPALFRAAEALGLGPAVDSPGGPRR